MKRLKKVNIELNDFIIAAYCAKSGHSNQKAVKVFFQNIEENCKKLYDAYIDGTYMKYVSYTTIYKQNTNGKDRIIQRPSLVTRIYQWLILNKLRPLYDKKDPLIGLNCKPGCGIQGKAIGRIYGEKKKNISIHERKYARKHSVLKKIKNLCYDKREFKYILSIDQRKCYMHIYEKHFRKAIKNLILDKKFINFAVNLCYVNNTLPVGTPTSPFVHHVIMLEFDIWLTTIASWQVKYADNVLLAFYTKEDAQRAKWRIMNYWWYVYQSRAKRSEIIIQSLDLPVNFCGFIVHRLPIEKKCQHGKGYTSIRKNIIQRASKATNKNWGSYFGILIHADVWNKINTIENNMKLKQLTEKIRITRKLDAPNIEIKDLVGQVFDIKDYDLRKNDKGEYTFLKMLIAIKEKDLEGNETGQILAREVHGNYQSLMLYLGEVEKIFSKDVILPIEDVTIYNQCGYIFEGSTNQLQYF